jgi:hypothetical protein
MSLSNFSYVYFLLFQCNQCNEPVAVAAKKQVLNLEEIDGATYVVKCRCGWSESLVGVEALAYWVGPWEEGKDIQHLTDRTDEIDFLN